MPVDCGQVAKSFGGGGHTQAAGFNISAEGEESAERILVSAVSAAIEKYMRTTGNGDGDERRND